MGFFIVKSQREKFPILFQYELRERDAAVLPKLYKQLTDLLGKREGMRIYKELYRKAHNESMLPFEKMVLSGEVETLYDAFKKAIPMFALFGMKMDKRKS